MVKKVNKGRVLIIGGAGFIGSHTADELTRRGYKIRILDNLSEKVHQGKWPKWIDKRWEKVKGDVRDRKTLLKSLSGVNYVIHLAAMMDFMPVYSQFFDTNVTSTALLYELIVEKKLSIKKVVVASSQFVYGEGRWKCKKDGEVYPSLRTNNMMLEKKWDPRCPKCNGKIEVLSACEWHQDPPNQYAISKYTQEMIALKLGKLNGIPSVAMRYSIVHGPRQSLRNAYSGALRVFTLQLLSGQGLSLYEDGNQLRDYVSVYDVARANADVLESEKANYENFNVGGGKGYTVINLVKIIVNKLGLKDKIKEKDIVPTGEFRVGDIRHAVSDISKIKKLVGWEPKQSEDEIVEEYVNWVKKQKLDLNFLHQANKNLRKSGAVLKSSK